MQADNAVGYTPGCKVDFFEECDFVGIHEGWSLAHEGTTVDAAGVRVPPASHGPSKKVVRALRARGIVRFCA